MPLDAQSSDRLGSLRFPLIVGVVFIHAYGTEIRLASGTVGMAQPAFVLDFLRNLLSQGVARIAVPIFFLMSGYFFFRDFSWSSQAYKSKLRSRGRTLFIPYLIWNFCGLMAIWTAQSLPATRPFFSGSMPDIPSLGAWERIDAMIGWTRLPILYQFWFIRDLMILVLLAPLVFGVLRLLPRITVAAVIVAWFFEAWPLKTPTIEALAFFLIGAACGIFGRSLFALDRWGFPVSVVYLLILVSDTLTKGLPFNPYLHKAGILVGIPCALFLTQLIVDRPRLKDALSRLGQSSFFVFAAHEPLMTGIRKIAYSRLLPSTEWSVLALYVAIPAFVILLLVLLHTVLGRLFPRLVSIVTGGR